MLHLDESKSEYAPCPNCRRSTAEKISFTWWGGFLGPRILTQVKCLSCGTKYNGKTGQDNTTGIVTYSVIAGIIALGLSFFLYIVVVLLAYGTR